MCLLFVNILGVQIKFILQITRRILEGSISFQYQQNNFYILFCTYKKNYLFLINLHYIVNGIILFQFN